METKDFFADYAEANRYQIKEVIGKVRAAAPVVTRCNTIQTGELWCGVLCHRYLHRGKGSHQEDHQRL